jgi:hypothetical protein
MERLLHATRSKGIATNNPTWSSGRAPAAVRKLLPDGDWNFKASGCKLDPSSIDDETSNTTAAMDEDTEEDTKPEAVSSETQNYYRFIGETDRVRELFAKAVICSHCKKGKLEVTFPTSGIATSIHTRCENCQTHSATPTASEKGHTKRPLCGAQRLI